MAYPETFAPGVDTSFSTKLNTNFHILGSTTADTSGEYIKLRAGAIIGKLTCASTLAATATWSTGDIIFQY
jgi:hypothetical protein